METKYDYLALIEVVKVKGFLFSSSKLKSIRGASYILDNLNLEKAKNEFVESYEGEGRAERIYFGGGNNKVLFANKRDAEEFVKKVEGLYTKEAPGVKIVSTVKKRRQDEELSDLMQRGEEEIKKGKNEGFSLGVEANSFGKYCTVCGENFCESYSSDIKQLLCTECNAKINAGAKINQLKNSDLAENGFEDYIYNRFYEQLKDKEINLEQLKWPGKTKELADKDNFIGFIYADGNRIGSFLREFNNKYVKGGGITEKTYKKLQRTFSSALDEATKEAVIEAVTEVIPPQEYINSGGKYPVEFIIAGGDDLILIVPADKSLAVADKFTQYFEQKINKKLADEAQFAQIIENQKPEIKITTSCGVAIAKSSYPINLLFDHSAQLLKSAKLRTYSLYQSYRNQTGVEHNYGAVDYDIINSSSIKDLALKRKEEYRISDKNYLTLRPYIVTSTEKEQRDLPDFLYLDNFMERVKELKKKQFPQTKLRQMLDAVHLERKEAILQMLKITDRLENKQHRKLLKKFYQQFNTQEDSYHGVYPWIKLQLKEKSDLFVTDIVDLVETYNFVASEVE
ncbi:MAG: Cas10/Cmr2 second palm domain-containing protein [Bacillota bacterium]